MSRKAQAIDTARRAAYWMRDTDAHAWPSMVPPCEPLHWRRRLMVTTFSEAQSTDRLPGRRTPAVPPAAAPKQHDGNQARGEHQEQTDRVQQGASSLAHAAVHHDGQRALNRSRA